MTKEFSLSWISFFQLLDTTIPRDQLYLCQSHSGGFCFPLDSSFLLSIIVPGVERILLKPQANTTASCVMHNFKSLFILGLEACVISHRKEMP